MDRIEQRIVELIDRRRGDIVSFVSVNAFLANSTNEPAPIAPSKRRRFRQRKPAASG